MSGAPESSSATPQFEEGNPVVWGVILATVVSSGVLIFLIQSLYSIFISKKEKHSEVPTETAQ